MRPGRIPVAELGDHLGTVVRVCGWAGQAAGPEGGLLLTDHTGTVALTGPVDGEREPVPLGSAIAAVGEVVAPARGTTEISLAVRQLDVLGPSEELDWPLKDGSSLDERLDWRWLDLRRPAARLIFQVQTTLERAMRQYWADHGFIEIHSPRLMATGPRPEELFSLAYFDRRAWLAQSPQFYKQMAMAAGFDRVFEVGPVFRVEPTVSARHATEFTSLDVEMAWVGSELEVMELAEGLMTHALARVAAAHNREIAAAFGVGVRVPARPFPRLSLAQAWGVAAGRGHPGGAGDLDAAAEALVAESVAQAGGQEMLWVTDYPEDLRPFYHMRAAEGSRLTRSFDLLWKGVEVASGAQREHRHRRLVDQARERRLPLEPIAHYLEFFRYGCPPHGGFGLGLNRLLMSLLGQGDVREVTFLPRNRDRLSP